METEENKNPTLFVVIPALNEEDNIVRTLEQIEAVNRLQQDAEQAKAAGVAGDARVEEVMIAQKRSSRTLDESVIMCALLTTKGIGDLAMR